MDLSEGQVDECRGMLHKFAGGFQNSIVNESFPVILVECSRG